MKEATPIGNLREINENLLVAFENSLQFPSGVPEEASLIPSANVAKHLVTSISLSIGNE